MCCCFVCGSLPFTKIIFGSCPRCLSLQEKRPLFYSTTSCKAKKKNRRTILTVRCRSSLFNSLLERVITCAVRTQHRRTRNMTMTSFHHSLVSFTVSVRMSKNYDCSSTRSLANRQQRKCHNTNNKLNLVMVGAVFWAHHPLIPDAAFPIIFQMNEVLNNYR